LDCRVDKSNRRLSFAACLFLAAKVNESNTMIAFDPGAETKSWVKPSKESCKIFESLVCIILTWCFSKNVYELQSHGPLVHKVIFFTHDWSIQLKQLYAAEWIVFTALGFSLKSTPSQVSFHFKRLLKVLEWDSRSYLGSEMYNQWQESLIEESRRSERRKVRREMRIKSNERRLLKLQRKLHSEGIQKRASTSSESQGFRRHSIDTVQSTAPETFQQDPSLSQITLSKEESPVAVKGILSRLARPKMSTQHSHGDDLNKLPKEGKKLTWSRHAFSTPNLKALDKELADNDGTSEIGEILEDEICLHRRDDTSIDYNMV
jgi:hypothetical protein